MAISAAMVWEVQPAPAGSDSNGGGFKTGTFVVPTESEVIVGVSFGAAGTEFDGNVILPDPGDVRTGITYGPNP